VNATETILARAAGVPRVEPGEEIWAAPDRMLMNDSSGPRRIAGLVEELGGVKHPERVVVVSDHFVPPGSVRHAEILRTTREWARSRGAGAFFEYEGVLHNLVVEKGLVGSGMLVVGADSHTTSAGALGAVAVAIGSTELATVLASGQVWLRVPETIRVDLTGALASRVAVRDVCMLLLGALGPRRASYKAVELGGAFVESIAPASRLVLCNQAIEVGAKNAIVASSPSRDARYAERLAMDVSPLEPLVALPPSPTEIVPARAAGEIPLDAAWIGSCAGGGVDDLRAAASVLAGKRVRVPLLVTPNTAAVYAHAIAEGTLATLVAAGATVNAPGCGACAGVHMGVQGPRDVVIATATRNFRGRMGSTDARVYLASAFTVAASAVAGRVIDPREVIP
jgi:3-isopropylmalate/(R)-2-methylmalate dehydratase large subunit